MATTSVTSSSSTTVATTPAANALIGLAAKRASAQKIITSLNAGSGIDVTALAQGLVDAERIPKENLINAKITKNESKVSGYSAISFMLRGFRDALTAMKDASSFNTVSISNSDAASFSATAVPGAAASSYSIKVNSLALPQRSISPGFAASDTPLNGGRPFRMSLTVGGAANAIDLLAGQDTPAGLVDAINAKQFGVKAQLVNTGEASNPYKVLLTGETGLTKSFSLSSSTAKLGYSSGAVQFNAGHAFTLNLSLNGGQPTVISIPDGADTPSGIMQAISDATVGMNINSQLQLTNTNPPFEVAVHSTKTPADMLSITGPASVTFHSPIEFSTMQSASDARVVVEGVEYTRTNNTVADLIPGVTLQLKSSATTAAGLTLSRDMVSIKSKITTLVTSYNETIDVVNQVTNPDSTLDVYGATLVGDSAARQIKQQLRDMMLGPSSTPGSSVGSLWQMGLSVDRNGVLAVDSTLLDKALTTNFDDVVKTFTANQNNRSATSPPTSTSPVFSSASAIVNGGGAFVMSLTTNGGSFRIPVPAAQTTPQGMVDAINGSNSGLLAMLVGDSSSPGAQKIVVIGMGGASQGFTLSARNESTNQAVAGVSFSGQGSGIAGDAIRKLTNLLSKTGSLTANTDNATAQNVKYKDSIADLGKRMQTLLERYTTQFAAMESLVGQINTQKTSLKSTFDGIMAMYTNK